MPMTKFISTHRNMIMGVPPDIYRDPLKNK
jgi:hypothetical protein